jgi:hypothetical protein
MELREFVTLIGGAMGLVARRTFGTWICNFPSKSNFGGLSLS